MSDLILEITPGAPFWRDPVLVASGWASRATRSRQTRLILLALLFFQVAPFARAQQTLRIAAAADLQPLLPALLTQFQQQTGIRAEASYQSSSTLAAQIIDGAPFDLFLAADLSFPQRVIDAGRAEESQPDPLRSRHARPLDPQRLRPRCPLPRRSARSRRQNHRHRQSRTRPLWARRSGRARAHRPLRQPPPETRHRGKHRAGRAVRRLRQCPGWIHLSHLSPHAAPPRQRPLHAGS